jgi:hypothetical protein
MRLWKKLWENPNLSNPVERYVMNIRAFLRMNIRHSPVLDFQDCFQKMFQEKFARWVPFESKIEIKNEIEFEAHFRKGANLRKDPRLVRKAGPDRELPFRECLSKVGALQWKIV